MHLYGSYLHSNCHFVISTTNTIQRLRFIIILVPSEHKVQKWPKVPLCRPNWRQYNNLVTKRNTVFNTRLIATSRDFAPPKSSTHSLALSPHYHPLHALAQPYISLNANEIGQIARYAFNISLQCIIDGVQCISLHRTPRWSRGPHYFFFGNPICIRRITNPERAITRSGHPLVWPATANS